MNIPTLQLLYQQVLADLESQMNITIPIFGKSWIRALAKVQAGKLWLLYLRLSIVQKNTWVDTCDAETLNRYGKIKIGRFQYQATQGKYLCSVTAEDGAFIPGGTQFISDDSSLNPSKLFVLDVDYVCNGYGDLIELRALESGDASSLSIGDTLTVTAPIALVDSVVQVISETLQPQAAEDLEDYRRKIIDSFRLLTQGGSPADYRLWADEVSGIVQTYPYCASGVTNQVNLFIEGDTLDGIPTLTDIDNVRISIESPTADRPARKPTTDIVNYLPVTPKVIDINIASFIPLPSADLQILIESAVRERLADIRPFVDSIDIVSERDDYFDTNSVIQIILETQPGSVFGAVTMTVDSVPANSVLFTNGYIPQFGSISYV